MSLKAKILIFAMLMPIVASAQCDTIADDKTTTDVKMIGIGATNILDTYLSQEKYSGTELRYISHVTKERSGTALSNQTVWQGRFSYSDNRSGNGGELAGIIDFAYTWHYNWHFLDNALNVKVGAAVETNLGFIYNTRNTNNPAQAIADISLSPSAVADYHFSLKGHPYSLRYEISVPLCGIMFSPNYGQSYYEIFNNGNYDHNAIPTYIGNAPSMRQMLTFDFSVCKTTFRIGYLGDYKQSHVNELKRHIYTNAIIIGVVKRFKITKLCP